MDNSHLTHVFWLLITVDVAQWHRTDLNEVLWVRMDSLWILDYSTHEPQK